jgi:hypothetical protein
MSDKFKRIGNEIWLEMEVPDISKPKKYEPLPTTLFKYNNRTHYSIHPDHLSFDWWKEGEVKELNVHFEIQIQYQDHKSGQWFTTDIVREMELHYRKVAIPIIQPTKAIPYGGMIDDIEERWATEKQPTMNEERKFTLDEMKAALMDAMNFKSREALKSRQFIHPANFIEQYFKEKFNIDL